MSLSDIMLFALIFPILLVSAGFCAALLIPAILGVMFTLAKGVYHLLSGLAR